MDHAMEILPSKLYWAPGLDSSLQDGSLSYVNALAVGHRDGKVATYYVPHYGSQGRAFGPFPMDAILRFCNGINYITFCNGINSRVASDPTSVSDIDGLKLENAASRPLCLTTAPGDTEAHTNACVLIGAYLILGKNWSAEDVARKLGKDDSERVFRGSWSESWVMKVNHCWQGLAAARDNGWLDLECLRDDALLESTCQELQTMALTYDCAWLVPSKILVSADPVTTMCDPNPVTFKGLWEDEDGVSTCASTPQSVSPKTSVSEKDCEVSSLGHALPCGESAQRFPLEKKTALSFRSFLQDCGVSLVIRNNSTCERGMPRPSYDASHWKNYGIEHMDLQFADGTIPTPSVVAAALASTRKMLGSNSDAVLIHCKGGFGRSVTLASCLACYHYDLPGSALLGWARIIRPGAFNTAEQEQFILSMKGRADVSRFAKSQDIIAKSQDSADIGAKVSCGCTVQ